MPDISVVVPLEREQLGLTDVLDGYVAELDALQRSWEMLVVPASATIDEPSEQWLAGHDRVRVLPACGGWGAAVRAGLAAGRGDVLCYLNWPRTSASSLAEMLRLALRNPKLVLRANRRTRDTRLQRLGSLLYNLECRLLLQIPVWDVNGTPKVFPRCFDRLLALSSQDELLDAEFACVCEQAGYPVIELPIEATLQGGTSQRTGYGAALKMYLEVPRLRARVRQQEASGR
jgi:hypothetical protein